MFFSTLNITKNICDDDDDGAVDVDDYGVALSVCVSARRSRRSRSVCKCGNFTFSSFFPSSWVSLAFLFLLYFRLCLSFAHAALARSSVSWAAGSVEVSNFDLAHSRACAEKLDGGETFSHFLVFFSLVAFSKAWKSSRNILRGCSWLLNRTVSVRVCLCSNNISVSISRGKIESSSEKKKASSWVDKSTRRDTKALRRTRWN